MTYDSDAINALYGTAGIVEIHQRTTFKCYQRLKDGGVREIEVCIFDRGPLHELTRYSAEAKTLSGKSATGNPARTIEEALDNVHWSTLGEWKTRTTE
jgi:hypothetical protein